MKIILTQLMIIFTFLLAFSSGPPDGRTGAPGELTCYDGCHNSYTLNYGTGNVSFSGVPELYVPGETYLITILVAHPSMQRWGFELSVKTNQQAQAGNITVTQSNYTQTGFLSGITYLKHRSAGTFNGQAGGAEWEFEWTAPESETGNITFYASGNCANGNGMNSNDYIYTTSISSNEDINFCYSEGDINVDGNLNIQDIILVMNYILGIMEFSEDQSCAGDVNEDGLINIMDIIIIIDWIMSGAQF
jgi:hypothetical protein